MPVLLQDMSIAALVDRSLSVAVWDSSSVLHKHVGAWDNLSV